MAYVYEMNVVCLESVSDERDLGIEISEDLNVSNQCMKAYSKANKILGLLKNIDFLE